MALRGGVLDFEEVQTIENSHAMVLSRAGVQLLLKPDKPRHTASTAHVQRDRMIEDCARIRPLRGYHHAIETENVDQRDFARKCYTPCVM